MNTITIDDRTYILDYTFNSFNYMEDLDIEELATIDKKPFKMFKFATILLLGAMNNDPRVRVDIETVELALVEYAKEKSIPELIEELIGLLQESDFFKSLQKKETPTTKKRK